MARRHPRCHISAMHESRPGTTKSAKTLGYSVAIELLDCVIEWCHGRLPGSDAAPIHRIGVLVTIDDGHRGAHSSSKARRISVAASPSCRKPAASAGGGRGGG